MEAPPAAYYRQALSAADMAAIADLADRLRPRAVPRAFGGMSKRRPASEAGGSEDRAASSSWTTNAAGVVGHTVTQLMPEFQRQHPELLAKLRRLVLTADEERGWGVVEPVHLVPRTIEVLRYKGALGANLGWHMDKSSTVTLLAMLSDSSEYSGGILQHESRGVVHDTHLRRGDVAVYRSHQRHHVTRVTSGERVSLAIEFWHINPQSSIQLHGGINGALARGKRTDGRPELSHPISPYFDLCPR
jgi:alkylated DNA repair dioxygenase AlkB